VQTRLRTISIQGYWRSSALVDPEKRYDIDFEFIVAAPAASVVFDTAAWVDPFPEVDQAAVQTIANIANIANLADGGTSGEEGTPLGGSTNVATSIASTGNELLGSNRMHGSVTGAAGNVVVAAAQDNGSDTAMLAGGAWVEGKREVWWVGCSLFDSEGERCYVFQCLQEKPEVCLHPQALTFNRLNKFYDIIIFKHLRLKKTCFQRLCYCIVFYYWFWLPPHPHF